MKIGTTRETGESRHEFGGRRVSAEQAAIRGGCLDLLGDADFDDGKSFVVSVENTNHSFEKFIGIGASGRTNALNENEIFRRQHGHKSMPTGVVSIPFHVEIRNGSFLACTPVLGTMFLCEFDGILGGFFGIGQLFRSNVVKILFGTQQR